MEEIGQCRKATAEGQMGTEELKPRQQILRRLDNDYQFSNAANCARDVRRSHLWQDLIALMKSPDTSTGD
jgi:hypothetical protein